MGEQAEWDQRDREREKRRQQEKEREKKEREKEKRSHSLSRPRKGAESNQTEPALASTSGKGAKPRSVVPASTSGDSRASSKGPRPVQTEPAKKSAQETMEYLTMLHKELFSCPKQRELKEKLVMLHKGFITREWTRSVAFSSN